MKYEIQRKSCSEERQKPLRRKHVRLDMVVCKMLPQRRELLLHEPIQLVQAHVQILKPVLVQIPEIVIVHQLD